MDGIHDLGGKEGYGAVRPQDALPGNRAGFSAAWEAKVFAILRALPAAGALQNSDQFRHAVERIRPDAYLTHGYYGRWLGALENLLAEAGVIAVAETDARAGNRASAAQPRVVPVKVPLPSVDTGGAIRPTNTPAKYQLGQRVLTQAHAVPGHTRLPAYARSRLGEITALHDTWVLPDTNAMGLGEQPCWLYTVAFTGQELWGPEAEAGVVVHLDLFEPYLFPPEQPGI